MINLRFGLHTRLAMPLASLYFLTLHISSNILCERMHRSITERNLHIHNIEICKTLLLLHRRLSIKSLNYISYTRKTVIFELLPHISQRM